MALDIGGATLGVDANNIQEALNRLNVECIQETITLMNTSMSSLRDAVDSAWVGQSAEVFKSNMEKDKETISKALNDAYEVLKSEMYQIVNEMEAADAELVKERNA